MKTLKLALLFVVLLVLPGSCVSADPLRELLWEQNCPGEVRIFEQSVSCWVDAVPVPTPTLTPIPEQALRNFVLISRSASDADLDKALLLDGLQKRYDWRDLEPTKNNYDFTKIISDLDRLQNMDRTMFVQIMDRNFRGTRHAAPQYIVDAGGTMRDRDGVGSYPRVWDPFVRDRYIALLVAMGEAIGNHPALAGMNTEESAMRIDASAGGYDSDLYIAALIDIALAAKEVFPEVIQYLNYVKGVNSYEALTRIADAIVPAGVGLGAPDIKIGVSGLEEGIFRVVREHPNTLCGFAIQWRDYEWKGQTPAQLLDFATNDLTCDYLFWLDREPYFTEDVLPILE